MLKNYLAYLLCLIGVYTQAQSEFITTWKTDNPGTSGDNQITIPTYSSETYDYTVDWGDGTSDTNVTGDITHTYASSGTYQISVTETFPRIFFNETGDKDKLLNIKQWGNIQWSSMESAFAGCSNLSVAAADAPDLSNVTSLRRMFYYCYYAFDNTFSREFGSFNGVENFNSWDVSTIADMSAMFDKSSFNQDISSWNVSLVEDMSNMFYSSTFNGDISSWNVSNVINMSGLFGSSAFNQDISSWDVGNVKYFDYIFNSTPFNHDITNWNVENAVSMQYAFSQGNFDQDLSSWNISNVIDLSNAFDESDLSKENYDAILTAWAQLPNLQFGVVLGANDAVYCLAEADRNSLITNFGWTINDYGSNCEDERAFITTWKTDNPGPSNDNQITIPTYPRYIYDYRVDWGDGSFDEGVTGDITHTYATPGEYVVSITGKFPRVYFNGSQIYTEFPIKNPDDLKIISIDQWGTNRWKSMSSAFTGCENLDVKATDIPDFSRGVSLNAMFYGCTSLVGNESISDWVIESSSTDHMFQEAVHFNIPIGNWDVSNVRYMYSMFENASSFNQDLSQWNVGNVEIMNNLFNGSGLSNKNYNTILIGWSQLPSLQNGVRLDAPNNYYCRAKEERQSIIDSYGWTINDAGENNECHFITTWKTDNPGTSGDNQITIPTYSVETYNYTVDWGDGTSDTNVTGDITHTYATAGTYQVAISGEFPAILFQGNQDSNLKITQVNQWGDIRWRNFSSAFSGCRELDVVATDTPNLENVISTQGMFFNCTSLLGNESFGLWDVSTIIDGSSMFLGCSLFNQNIGGWDVSNMVYMDYFFWQAESFNQPIGNWDVSNAERIFYMFSFAESFNQDISEWRFPKVTNLAGMFQSATSFSQDISSWDVSNIENFGAMFNNAASFDQPIGIWDMSNAVELSLMFAEANSFTSDITNWDVSNVTTMEGLFKYNTTFNQDLSSWDTSSVTSMAGMFEGAAAFEGDISSWDVSTVENMSLMFENSGISLENYDKLLDAWANLPSLQTNVIFDVGNSQYCESEEARQFIIDTYGWIINDTGKIPYCNEDNDGDGVLDHLDACLDTQPGAVVNASGCEVIPNTAIKVYASTPSCVGREDGSIEITMETEGHLLDITLEGESYSNQFVDVPSGTPFKVDDLPEGSYSVSVSIPEIVFEQHYVATINSLESVTGKRALLDSKAAMVTYSVSGSTNYQVLVNDKKKNFSFADSGQQTITLDHIPTGLVAISIFGESDCQGMISDSFYFGDSIEVFPTITSSTINIFSNSATYKAQIFDFTGRLVNEKQLDGQENTVDLSTIKSGTYILKLYMDGEQRTLKIIKK
ncbi:BspA family leucine-rich repeat surface protein [Muricauda sp. CAU 1633]|uniref:BspA family leucine-rich repeat surface protein n=1 Tax=Allomuricauda sp. CAU 1633 TaxID=2816036 RepID=UPI001A8C19D5|nr:BspA family leucine-rich repeat surface protein [Muricauda sp. CAU 1633]MBO0320865.1 BspA family leucine-rich repeat surface protein [Muricauda sp. CAU 1633]